MTHGFGRFFTITKSLLDKKLKLSIYVLANWYMATYHSLVQ